MLTGVMKLKGQVYTLFYEEYKYKERVDICKPRTIFNIEPDKVLFSRVTGKISKRKGEDELFNGYEDIINLVVNVTSDHVKKDTSFENGNFVTVYSGTHPNGTHFEKIRKNSKLDSLTYYIDDDNLIKLEYMSEPSELNLQPLDAAKYKEELSLIQKQLIANDVSTQDFRDAKTLKRLFNLSHLDNKDIGFINSEAEAEKYLRHYKNLPTGHKIGFDFETTTLEMHCESDGRMTGVVISQNNIESRYFPFGQDNTYNLPEKYFQYLLEAIEHTTKIAHNAQFERLVLAKYGFTDYKIDRCSLITTQIATGMPLGMRYDLKSLYENLTGEKNLDLKDIFLGKVIKFNVLPQDVITLYACPDGYSTLVVDEHYYNKCDEMRKGLLKHIEWELPVIKAESRLWGIHFNKEKLINARDIYAKDIENLSNLFKSALKVEANLNSADQLETIIYDKLRCPVVVRTKSRKRSTGKLALNYLAKLKKPKEQIQEKQMDDIISADGSVLIEGKDLMEARYPTMVILQQYKLMQKLMTTYFDKFIENPYDFYHFWVNQNVRTGRQSSNMHQLPKFIAQFAEADDEDFALCDADWSQVELRMMIKKSNERELIKLCNNPMLDIHRMIYSIVLGKEIWEVSKEERGKSKPVNFGVVYMIQGMSLAKQIYGANPTKEQVEECTHAIQVVYDTFPRIYKYTRDNIQEAKELGYVRTEFGRIRSFPNINNTAMYDRSVIAEMERQANNTKTQGSCADLMKISEIKIRNWIKEKGWDKLIDTKYGKRPMVRLVLSLHDEILVSHHKSIPEWQILEMMFKSMLHNIGGEMPLYPAMGFGKVWADAKSDKTELSVGAIQDIIEKQLTFGDTLEERHKNIKQYSDDFDMAKLDKFMEGIIAQNYPREEIWKHVRDGVFTHTIIDLYPNKKIKDHYEKIEYAVNAYLDELEDRKKGIKVHKYVEEESKRIVDELNEVLDTEMNIDPEDLVVYDDKGNIMVYDDITSDDFEEMFSQNIDDEYEIKPPKFIEADHVYETLQDVIITMKKETPKEVIQQIEEILISEHDEMGLKSVQLLIKGKLIRTKYRVEKCSENFMKIEEILRGVE